MTSRFTRSSLRVLALLLAFIVGLCAFAVIGSMGLLSTFGVQSESQDRQVIRAITRTQEVSLLSLSIQGIANDEKCRKAFGGCVPGSTEKAFLMYNFDAKLGIDGDEVRVKKTGKDAYLISVPGFRFIGYSKPTFKVATESGGVLAGITPDIDKVEMINKILNDEAQTKYVALNNDTLEDQTKVFYDSLITSIAKDAVTTFEFRA